MNVHEAFWLPHRRPVVGNVAALVPHKGQRHLIEAAHLVVQQIPDARFVILGEGELREQLERLVREHHLEKHVLLPGFRTDVLGCIKGFDLFVMSSVTEGLGTSLLDAMACDKAIVGTRAGGIPEVVDEGTNGLLVEPRNSRALADAILRLLQDTALRAGWARPGSGACASASPSSGWSPRPPPSTRASRGRRTWRMCPRTSRSRGPSGPPHRPTGGSAPTKWHAAAIDARSSAGRRRAADTASSARRLNPHAFIIPRWQIEKSYFTGSSGSSARSDA